ncbi:hypothetical protein C3B44_07185 [Corynebacterium yudongzhengii]|uniref:SdpI family protein n=2 Tax=Corynebacterium yudongzhengii TaxID=2080740 RepID=A0A2U1T486_9CORY|nr:hypothetical protein C3B44_07185 [Corynebacterium yudongzhengii]PWC00811.1 hypothetical protein DF222_10790 [Corynebacterium yudongzhengii]
MTAYSIIMTVALLATGALILWLGVRSGQGKLPKNQWVGIRTEKLMASDEAWVKGHKAAAGYLKLSSIPLFAGGVACLVLDDSLIAWGSLPVVVLLIAMVLLASKQAHVAV